MDPKQRLTHSFSSATCIFQASTAASPLFPILQCPQLGRSSLFYRLHFHRIFNAPTRPRSGRDHAKGGIKMSSERQGRSDDESPSTSSGSSDADQRDPAVPEPDEAEERKQQPATPPQQQKKPTKLSSKTTAKLSTSAKRIQKELAEITLDPPPNC
ncbi:unnamed protein product, partial [Coregonus sp. 'balchen']